MSPFLPAAELPLGTFIAIVNPRLLCRHLIGLLATLSSQGQLKRARVYQ